MKLMSENGALVLILLLGLVIRLVSLVPIHANGYTSDEREYVYIAKNVAAGNGFIDSNGELSKRSPLYPIALGYLFRIFGESLWLPHIIGCLLGTLLIVLGYKLSMDVWPDGRVAIVTAAAIALYPGLIIYAGLLQTETLYLVFMLLAFIAAFRLINSGRIADALLLGITSGLATLTRAVFLGFFPFLLILLWWKRRQAGEREFVPLMVATAMFCLVLLPWTIRNYSVHGALVPVSSWGGQALLIGNNPYATGTWSVKPGFDEWYMEQAAGLGIADPKSLRELEQRALDRTIALDYIKSHPFHVMWLDLKKTYMFWIYPITHSDTYLPAQAIAVASDFLLYIGGAIGLIALWQDRKRLMPLFVAVAFFALVQVVLHSESRYRLPLVPVFCLLSGWGSVMMVDRVRRNEFFSHYGQRLATGILAGFIVLVYSFTGWLFLIGRI